MVRSSKLPQGWNEHTLESIVDVRLSGVNKHSVDSEKEVFLCNYMDVWNNEYITNKIRFMQSTASDADCEKLTLRRGDVLLTKDSETKHEIAEPAVVWEEIENLVLGYHLALLRPNLEQVNGHFLSSQLRLETTRRQLVNKASGATRYGLTLDSLRSAIVWLPNIETQIQISKILRSIDDAIEATRSVIAQTRQLKTALLQDLLSNGIPGLHSEFLNHRKLGRLPKKWQVRPINEVSSQVTDGEHLTPPRTSEGVLLLSARNIRDGQLNLQNVDYISRDTYEILCNRVCCEPGDILISCSGSIGRICPVPSDLEFALVRSVAIVKPNRTILHDGYAHWCLRSNVIQKQIATATSKLAQGNLFQNQVKQLQIPIPPKAEQEGIASALDRVDEKQSSEEANLRQLLDVKTALSQGLLSGNIPVKEAVCG